MADELIPAVVYAAKSSPDEKDSVGSQVEHVREAIESVGGREIIAEPFTEENVSAYHGERGPKLDAALSAATDVAAERGAAELWVFHTSRLARGDGTKGHRSLMKIYADALYENVRLRSASDDEFLRPELVGIASTTAHKYSADHGAHVARGKRAAFELGKWTGGPAPDGYRAERSLDDRGKKHVALVLDPEREPVIRNLFELAEQGLGDATVARTLNAAGLRTKTGRPWTRRRVQSTVGNHVYAGRVVRWGEGSRKGKTYRRDEKPQIMPGEHPALIDPDRLDRIQAMRADRDRSAEGRRRGSGRWSREGRPATRYALAKLAVCDRCGEGMYAVTSPYKRKDGTQRRSYVCAGVHFSKGTCDQPRLDAEKVDAAVVAYLDRIFIDFEAWVGEVARGTEQRCAAAQAALDGALGELDTLDRRAERIERDYLRADDEGSAAADDFARMVERTRNKRRNVERAIDEHRAALAELDEPRTDALLDHFNDVARAVRGEADSGGSLAEVNERLRSEFEWFRLGRIDDETIGVLPVLRERTVPDLAAAWSQVRETEDREPTTEEVEDYHRWWPGDQPEIISAEEIIPTDKLPARSPALLLAAGRDAIRPPAKAVEVPDQKSPNQQESWHSESRGR